MSSPRMKKANWSIKVLGVGSSSIVVAICISQLVIYKFITRRKGIVTKELNIIRRIDFFRRTLHSYGFSYHGQGYELILYFSKNGCSTW
jgi:hypothetical protein